MMDCLPPEILVLLGIASACSVAASIAVVVMAFEVRSLSRVVARLIRRLRSIEVRDAN